MAEQKKIVDSTATTNKTVQTEKDGTVIETYTTFYTDKFADGTTGNRTEVKQIKKPPVTVGSKGGPAILDPNLNPKTSKAQKVPNITSPAFIQECLGAHNRLRANHGSPPLTLDDDLAKIAQAWATELVKKAKMGHNNTGFGENVYWNTEQPTGTRAAEMWYSEVQGYDFSKNIGQKGTGHFTQLVWAETKVVGIAMDKCPDDEKGYYVVANYFPTGNILGRYSDNVRPPGSAAPKASAAEPEGKTYGGGAGKKSIAKKK